MNQPLKRKIPHNPDNELLYVLILAAIQFAHMVDFVVLMPLGPTLMADLSISPAEFGTLVSSYNFAAAVAGLIFGFFADKFDRKSLLIITVTGFITGTFLCGLMDSFGLLVAARTLTGAFGGMMNGLIFAILADLIPYERRGKAMGIIMSSFSVASVIGVPIGLAISDYSHWSYTFYFIAAFSIIILFVAWLSFPNLNDHLGRDSDRFLTQLKSIFGNKLYLKSFLFIFFVSGSMFLLIPFLSPYAVKNMGIATHQLKYMYLVGGLCTIATARLFGVLTDKMGAIKLYPLIVLTSAIPIFLFTNAGETSFIMYLVIGAFFMTTVSGRMIPCMTLVTEVPLLKERGIFMSVLHSIRASGSAFMTFLGGFLIGENSSGKLIHFNSAGYLSIIVGIGTIFLGKQIYQDWRRGQEILDS